MISSFVRASLRPPALVFNPWPRSGTATSVASASSNARFPKYVPRHEHLVYLLPSLWRPLGARLLNATSLHRFLFLSKPSVTTTIHTHGAEPFFRSCKLCSYSRTSQHFMEPEGSLPCSQQPSTGPYPESDQSHPISLRPILIPRWKVGKPSFKLFLDSSSFANILYLIEHNVLFLFPNTFRKIDRVLYCIYGQSIITLTESERNVKATHTYTCCIQL
jgi:hypothetical protein